MRCPMIVHRLKQQGLNASLFLFPFFLVIYHSPIVTNEKFVTLFFHNFCDNIAYQLVQFTLARPQRILRVYY